jgi:hypothetical protein
MEPMMMVVMMMMIMMMHLQHFGLSASFYCVIHTEELPELSDRSSLEGSA